MSKKIKASNYIHHAKEYYSQHPDMMVVLYDRLSGRKAGQTLNHINHIKILRTWLEKRNIPILGCFVEVISGRDLTSNRKALIQARKLARKHNAVIITPCTNRYLRNANKQADIPPTQEEFEKLIELTRGVPLLTLLHPDLPPSRVRSKLTIWGQRIKGNKGGRPRKQKAGYLKERRLKLKPVARQYYYKDKISISEISRLIDVSRTTVDRWIKTHPKI